MATIDATTTEALMALRDVRRDVTTPELEAMTETSPKALVLALELGDVVPLASGELAMVRLMDEYRGHHVHTAVIYVRVVEPELGSLVRHEVWEMDPFALVPLA